MTQPEFGLNPFGQPNTTPSSQPPAAQPPAARPQVSPAPTGTIPRSANPGQPELAQNPFGSPAVQAAPIGQGQNELDVNPFNNGTTFKQRTLGVLSTIGKTLQPFAAPQQIVFGAIGGLEDLATGKGAAAAVNTFQRGLNAAGADLTYGLPSLLSPTHTDARQTYVNGYELAKKANAPDWLAKPLGIAADFIVDVPLLGKLGKATGLARALDISTGIDHAASLNMAASFVKAGGNPMNPADWDIPAMTKFATRVAAAPLSTAPIRDIFTALPQGTREQLAQRVAGAIEGGRSEDLQAGQQLGRAAPLGKTVGQMLISRFGYIRGLPTMDGRAINTLRNSGDLTGTGIARQLEGDIYAAQAEGAKLTYMSSDAKKSYDDLTMGLSAQSKKDFDDIAYRLLDWDDANKFSAAHNDLDTFANSIGNPGFKQEALQGLWKAAALDAYTGLLRYRAGTMGVDKTSGSYQGLQNFETLAFGQPKTVNPLQGIIDARAQGNIQAGLPPGLPEPAMHMRRAFMLQTRPHDVIQRLEANPLPAQIMHIDDTKLANITQSWMAQGSPNVHPTILQGQAQSFAQDFKQFYTNPANNEPQAMMQFMTQRGYTTQEATDFLNHIGNQWHQNGVTYRPPNPEVIRILRDASDNKGGPTLVGASSPALGNSNKPLGSRADLPEWYQDSMEQIKDIGTLLDQNIRIGTKQYVNRSVVQSTYDFLKQENGIVTTQELGQLRGGAAQNWRRIDTSLAQRLKGMDDPFASISRDTPFTDDMHIPAVYHDLLTSFSTIDDPGIKNTMLQMVNASFKAHKVANPAAIARDIATNFRFADDMGVNPMQLSQGVRQAVTLRNRAVAGDGAFDTNASITVNGQVIKWSEVMDHGGFLHGNFVVNEIDPSYRALRNDLATGTGNWMQRTAAAFIDHADRVARIRDSAIASGDKVAQARATGQLALSGAVDLATGLGGPVTKMMTDIKGDVDTMFKLGVYIQKRAQGMTGEKAAQHADEMFFNYQNQPIMVDFLRKNGISPFAAFQFMASGRFMRTMYENPYAVSRWYRLPQSITAGDAQAQGEIQNTAPDYMTKDLWIPFPALNGGVTRDSNNRMMMFNLNQVMPESALFNFADGDAISNWVPPTVQAAEQILTGKGYGGVSLYAGGKSFAETAAQGPTGRLEAARGMVKALHQFGATPWAPGSPMADRMAKSIVAALIPADQITGNPIIQGYLKMAQEGPFAAGLSPAPIAAQGIGAAAPQDMGVKRNGQGGYQLTVPYTPLRAIGLSAAPVTGLSSEPGTARSQSQGGKYSVKDITAAMRQEIMRSGGDPKAIQMILARYLPEINAAAANSQQQSQFEQQQSIPYYNQKK